MITFFFFLRCIWRYTYIFNFKHARAFYTVVSVFFFSFVCYVVVLGAILINIIFQKHIGQRIRYTNTNNISKELRACLFRVRLDLNRIGLLRVMINGSGIAGSVFWICGIALPLPLLIVG